MPKNDVALANIFQTVAKTLAENQQSLNRADEANQDHGDNMVRTFQTIAGALQKKQGSSDSVALGYAAKQLAKTATSGSGKLYAQGLAQAAGQMQGKQLDVQTGMQLLQTLIGGGQAPQQAAQPAGGDVLASLLGSLAGSGQPQPASQAGGGDLLGSLLGGLAGGNAGNKADNGLDVGDLLNAGMAFMQSKQSGGSNLDAALQALMAGSGMGGSAHRSQSTQLVISTFLKALGAGN